jgi:hypothetical protein
MYDYILDPYMRKRSLDFSDFYPNYLSNLCVC